jgi:hypothetical protein
MAEDTMRELYELRNTVDELIEEGLVKRWSVSEMLGALLPRVCERLGTTGAFVETYGEDLELHVYQWSAGGKPLAIPQKDDVSERTSEARRERVLLSAGDALVVAQHLDVAGAWFGRAGLVAAKGADGPKLGDCLNAVCEVLDNYLFSIRAMREKHLVTMKLGNALRHRVLPEGLKQAVAVLSEAIPIERMVLVYVAEENAAKTLHVQMFEGSELKVDTLAQQQHTSSPLRLLGRQYLAGENSKLLDELGVKDADDDAAASGAR